MNTTTDNVEKQSKIISKISSDMFAFGTPKLSKQLNKNVTLGLSPVTELALSFQDMSARLNTDTSVECETPIRRLLLNDTNSPASSFHKTKSYNDVECHNDSMNFKNISKTFQKTKSMPENSSTSFVYARSPTDSYSEDSDESKKKKSPPRLSNFYDSEINSSPENEIKNVCHDTVDCSSRDSGISDVVQGNSKCTSFSRPFKQLLPYKSNIVQTSTPVSSLTLKFQTKSHSIANDKILSPYRSFNSDDGFVDLLEIEQGSFNAPTSERLKELINSCLLPLPESTNKGKENTPCSRRRSSLKHYKSINKSVASSTITKRKCDSFMSDSKRRKSIADESPSKTWKRNAPPFILNRSLSVPECNFFLDNDNRFVGDYTRPPSLPTILLKHSALKYVTVSTVANLINKSYENVQSKIIDCRYPYEYDGGHIKGAENFFLKKHIQAELFTNKSVEETSDVILIFHCEFSSERGPRLAKFTRELDRNQNDYPRLHYPEVYIMEGGYKEFFLKQKKLCEPETYMEMANSEKAESYKMFRSMVKFESCDNELAKKNNRVGLRRQKSCRKLIN